MDSNSPHGQRRARLKYEWARVRRATWGFAPALVFVGIAVALSKHPGAAVEFGAAMFALGVALLWYGRDVRRAVLPGLLMGLLPLAFALCANRVGHMCMGDGCMTLCVPACVAGGLGAGIGVSLIGLRGRHGLGYWLGASALAVFTGAMGCACVGYGGVAGLVLGYGFGLLPLVFRQLGAESR